MPITDASLSIGGLTLSPPLALAPMVGLSHSALRTLTLELGGVGLLFTEMLSVTRLPQENAIVSPFLFRSPEEQPLFYQLFVSPGQDVVPAVERLHQLGAQGIDLNLGCPAPNLRRQGAGCALTNDHEQVRHIVAMLRCASSLPLSAKIRLGTSLNEEKLVDFCQMLESEGVDLLSVHGRLHGEKFCRRPHWDWIGKIKSALKIPVLANGGIFSVEDAKKCLALSGADGLMIGRGAACRPWLFAEIARDIYGVSCAPSNLSLPDIYFRFVQLLERFRPERRLGRLKQFTHYYGQNFTFGHHLASAVQTSTSVEQACDRAQNFFCRSKELQV
ncbi:MAG: tRNA-dihydrouridine synthase family protein [Proteobacteria bacterium]|nr:tRNA-dihydrouridine synthase family protein [Pseudomonadota bacterium]